MFANCGVYIGSHQAHDTTLSVLATAREISEVAEEEGFPGPEEEDLVEAARRIRLGGLGVGILYEWE